MDAKLTPQGFMRLPQMAAIMRGDDPERGIRVVTDIGERRFQFLLIDCFARRLLKQPRQLVVNVLKFLEDRFNTRICHWLRDLWRFQLDIRRWFEAPREQASR